HLDVRGEVTVRVRIGRVRREVHGWRHRLDVHVDARLRARLLDDLLVLLAGRVDGRLVDELQLLAVLGADAVGAALPSRGLENLAGPVDVEFPLRGLRLDARRSVEEVGGGDAGPAVDLLLDRAPVDQEIQRLADGEIREERMSRLDRRLLALYLRPGVGLVELDVLDVATEGGVDAALAALLQALEDVVLHLHVPGVVVLARLEHGTRRRDGVAATLHLDLVEERPVGLVIARVELAPNDVTGLEVHEAIGTGPHRLEVRRRLARLAALEGVEEVFG